MRGQPGQNIRPHARLLPRFHGHVSMDDLTTERSFDSQAMCVIDVLGCLYNQALADVRSTGAGTKCLYCMFKGEILITALPLWLPVKFRIDFKILLMVLKAINGLAPEYVSELLAIIRTNPRPQIGW